MSFHTPALSPGIANDVVVTNPDGTTGTLVKGLVSDFLDVPPAQQFYAFVTTLVSNGVTVGWAAASTAYDNDPAADGRLPDEGEARALLHPAAVPTQVFADVPALDFAPWINELDAEGITGGCGNGTTYCPNDPVKREQMAVLLLRRRGPAYVPPACVTATFADMPATTRSRRGSRTSSPATSPEGAAGATTARRPPPPAARWRSSS